jgi:hypothetical protein
MPPAIRAPSQADIQMTKAIIDIAGPLGIAVHDPSDRRERWPRQLEGAEADLAVLPVVLSAINRTYRPAVVCYASESEMYFQGARAGCISIRDYHSSKPTL